ncbi:recombinase family protein [Agarivorans sp. 1_MG-2023]|uniref:recombinase family protein n=1 Tax=Agarivorans sp. 1_MG-2023 TaxID=3062634 RepID=UPI0026E199A4|nr:recombinase family protein [Agarivorans sp. 1_MG-2023]MDO6763406.1 recombinase family protein [Agarivorans sp. 1_MG-2023]
MRKFGYARVSSLEQDTEVQRSKLIEQGVEEKRLFSENVSGSVSTKNRLQFKELLLRIEGGDKLYVTKLDRLGRNMLDVCNTLEMLKERDIGVVCLDIGEVDLTSPAGSLQVKIMAAVSEFERDRIRERTAEGRAKAKAEGRSIGGRPPALDTTAKVLAAKAKGLSQNQVTKELKLSIATVKRHWNKD